MIPSIFRMKIGDIVAEPLEITNAGDKDARKKRASKFYKK